MPTIDTQRYFVWKIKRKPITKSFPQQFFHPFSLSAATKSITLNDVVFSALKTKKHRGKKKWEKSLHYNDDDDYFCDLPPFVRSLIPIQFELFLFFSFLLCVVLCILIDFLFVCGWGLCVSLSTSTSLLLQFEVEKSLTDYLTYAIFNNFPVFFSIHFHFLRHLSAAIAGALRNLLYVWVYVRVHFNLKTTIFVRVSRFVNAYA